MTSCLLLGPLHLLLCSLQVFVRSSYLHDLPPLHSQSSDLLVFNFTNKRKGEASIKFLLPFTVTHGFCSSSLPSCNFRVLPCVLGNLREANRSLVWGSSPANQPQTLMLNGKLASSSCELQTYLPDPWKVWWQRIALGNLWFAFQIDHLCFSRKKWSP